MMQSRNLASVVLAVLLGGAAPIAGQTQAGRVAISPQRIASAVAQAGWKVRPEQVRLLSAVTSSAADPWLQVVQVTNWHEGRLRVELRCHDPQVCLPFYVL